MALEFYRRPILALTHMVHAYGTAALKRFNKPQGDVERETDLEYIEADNIGVVILEKLGLTRTKVASELGEFKDDWKALGEELDLSFLSPLIQIT
jgi:hypothetical protein